MKDKTIDMTGQEMYNFAGRIFPINRSITGSGVRETLNIIKEIHDELEIKAYPTGMQAFDWNVPKEWNVNEAYIENSKGDRIIDFKENNLHVLGYSIPVDEYVDLENLKKYIYTEKEQPDAIPYVTSYYKERFGFCMSENLKNSLVEDTYHMYIDSTLSEGELNYGEMVINGTTDDEIIISTYVCHPSMANNECSGPALAVALMDYIKSLIKEGEGARYTYRFLFVPESIGSISYMSQNLAHMKAHVKAIFVLSCVGDNNDYSIIHSRYGKTLADKVLTNVLKYHYKDYSDYSYLQRGSDEKHYNAPGVDLPAVAFCRSKYGEFKEYHTSEDNMDYISPEGFDGAFDVMKQVIDALEYNYYYRIKTLCEPQLGKRGLFPDLSRKGQYDKVATLRNFIGYADGLNDIIDISEIIRVPVKEIIPVVDKLKENDLLDVYEKVNR